MSKSPLTNGHDVSRYYTNEVNLTSSSDLEILEKQQTVEQNNNKSTTNKRTKLQTAAIIISWISAVFSVITGVAAIDTRGCNKWTERAMKLYIKSFLYHSTVLSQMVKSESLFGYGLDSLLDSLSSIVVLWRFYESATSTRSEARERKACIGVALLFFVSALSLLIKSIITLVKNSMIDSNHVGLGHGRLLVVVFSSCCGVIALVIASVKIYLGHKLHSRVLITDSIITFVGAAISFLGVIGLELYSTDADVWYLDALFGLCCGIFLFLYGLKLLVQMTCRYKKDPIVTDIEDKP